MADRLAEFHRAGYWHGDLQPAHFVSPDAGATCALIDFDVAVARDAVRHRHGGGMVHYVSPEVAGGMLDGRTDIALDGASETYAFGAVMHVLRTGFAPVRYTLDGKPRPPVPGGPTREEKLRAIVRGDLRPSTRRSTEDPINRAVRDLVRETLHTRPGDRPALGTVAAALRDLSA
jgi:hypothetical protein